MGSPTTVKQVPKSASERLRACPTGYSWETEKKETEYVRLLMREKDVRREGNGRCECHAVPFAEEDGNIQKH
jgi:hypothetical protein